MNQNAFHLDDDEELVVKAVGVEAKAGLQPSSYVRETDQQVPWENRPAHTIAYKCQTQGAVKDHCGDKSKAKASVSTSIKDSELSNKARKDKKKK